jgi:hypothetical protein
MQQQQRRLLEGRLKQIESFEERLAEDAKRLREEAKLFPPGAARDRTLREARQAETGSHVSAWLGSSGIPQPISAGENNGGLVDVG